MSKVMPPLSEREKGMFILKMLDDVQSLVPNGKRRPLCCMEIHRGFIRITPVQFVLRVEAENRAKRIYPWKFPESEILYKEDWRRCKGYRASGTSYCVAHRDQRIRNLFSAARVIEYYYTLYLTKKRNAKSAAATPRSTQLQWLIAQEQKLTPTMIKVRNKMQADGKSQEYIDGVLKIIKANTDAKKLRLAAESKN